MNDLIAVCGANCGHCPSYKNNVRTDEDRKRTSDGWHKYLGFRLSPEKLLRCDGCLMPTEENPVRYFKSGCYLRKCAEKNGVETCAYCSGFPCEDLRLHEAPYTREAIASQIGISSNEIPEDDYLTYIEPYEGTKHLDAARDSLAPEDIVQMSKPFPKKPNPFPDLHLSHEEARAFHNVYQLLSHIIAITGDTHARETVLEKRRKYLLKLLYVLGVHGKLKEDALVIGSEPYLAQLKGIPFYSDSKAINERFKMLEEFGIHCELVPVEKGWSTPKGALRKTGWYIKMSFDGIGGVQTLEALQKYAKTLDRKYGKKAYRYFSKADMQSLQNRGRCP